MSIRIENHDPPLTFSVFLGSPHNIFIMEKVIVLLDGLKVDINTARFACYLARLTHSKLTGVLIESSALKKDKVLVKADASDVLLRTILDRKTDEDIEKLWIENVNFFEDITEEEGVEAFIEADKTLSTFNVLEETRFADILILDAKAFYNASGDEPNHFVKQILQEAECPVVIAPDNFQPIEDVVFCYNGMKSSVFAMKQFIYLFPQLKSNRAKLITIADRHEVSEEDEQTIADWLRYHFNDVEFIKLKGDALNAFFNYLQKKENDFVVMGAYGKGLLTTFFESDTEGKTDVVKVPLFISHC